MKKILFFLFFPLLGVAQNGPGGVGSSKGNSSLVLWLNAGYIVQGGGSPAAIWLDNSGFENHAITEVGKGPSQNHSGLKLKSRDRSKEKKDCSLIIQT